MGYKNILNNFQNVYECYRDGLCHEYTIKGQSKTGVFSKYLEEDIPKFENLGVDTTKGILLHRQSPDKIFIIKPYLNDFISGIEKFIKEMG